MRSCRILIISSRLLSKAAKKGSSGSSSGSGSSLVKKSGPSSSSSAPPSSSSSSNSSNTCDENKVILSMHGVTKMLHNTRRVSPVLDNVSLSFFSGAKIGVLGSNGAGKSTLLRILAGKDTDYDGVRNVAKGISIGMLDQEPTMQGDKTVMEVVSEGVHHKLKLLSELERITAAFGDDGADIDKLCAEQARIQSAIDRFNCWDVEHDIQVAMRSLRVPPPNTPVGVISGGERRRVALARLLLSEPDILMLDEPTNHLDAESVMWLEHFLKAYKGTVIAVTHDRYFLDNVANWILEVSRGRLLPFRGNYTSWLEKKMQREEVEGKKEKQLQRLYEKELEWVRMNPAARTSKNKARLANFAKLSDERSTLSSVDSEGGAILIPPGPRLGNDVLEVKNLTKKMGDKEVFNGLSFRLEQGAIVGVVGPNGAGKTTLLKLLTGDESPDGGSVSLGETVQMGFVSQNRDSLQDDMTVYDAIAEGEDEIKVGDRSLSLRTYVAQFNFKGVDQEKKLVSLSGGERNRVHLARLLKSGCNLLLLDEPTNDLDVQTLQSLEEAIPNFPGCAIIVSHDRWFLDRLCTHVLAFDGNGSATFFAGNFSDYEVFRRQSAAKQQQQLLAQQ